MDVYIAKLRKKMELDHKNPQHLVTIRGEGYVVTERAIDVQVAGLRKKLGDYGRYIETVRGVGYRFKDAG